MTQMDQAAQLGQLNLGRHSIWPVAAGKSFFVASVATDPSERVLQALSDCGVSLRLLRQVHGQNFVFVEEKGQGSESQASPEALAQVPPEVPPEADAWLWSEPPPANPEAGKAVAVYTADCVPACLYLSQSAGYTATDRRVAHSYPEGGALMHLGRKGIESGLLLRCAERLAEHCRALGLEQPFESMHLHLGPAIGACCYEVPLELAQDFCRNAGLSEDCLQVHRQTEKQTNHAMLDLKRAICQQARSLGIAQQNIYVEALCTCCQAKRYLANPEAGKVCYSYRCGHKQQRIYTLLVWQ